MNPFISPQTRRNNISANQAHYDALSIAKFLFSLDPQRNYFTLVLMPIKEDWESIPLEGSFRLNKLLHICQMLYCAKYQRPLFHEKMLAFEHGAVVEAVRINYFELYRHLGKEKTILEKADQQFIKKVFAYFRHEDNETLETFSHDDPAWRLGREKKDLHLMPLNSKLISYYKFFLDDIVEEIEQLF